MLRLICLYQIINDSPLFHYLPIFSLCPGEKDLDIWSEEEEKRQWIARNGKEPLMRLCHTAVTGMLALLDRYEDCAEDLATRGAKQAISSMLVSPT